MRRRFGFLAAALACLTWIPGAAAQDAAPARVLAEAPDRSWALDLPPGSVPLDPATLGLEGVDCVWELPGRDGGPPCRLFSMAWDWWTRSPDREDVDADYLRSELRDELDGAERGGTSTDLDVAREVRPGLLLAVYDATPPSGEPTGSVQAWIAARAGMRLVSVTGHAAAIERRRAEFIELVESVRFEPLPPPDTAWQTPARIACAVALAAGLLLVLRGIRRDVRSARAAAAAEDGDPGAGDLCPNCGETGVVRYCPSCGQRRIRGRIRLGEVIGEWFAKLLDLEHGLGGTVAGLTFRPLTVIREYVAGRRATYCAPVRYFMTWFVVAALAEWPLRQRAGYAAERLEDLAGLLPRDVLAGGRDAVAAADEVGRWLGGPGIAALCAVVAARMFPRTAWTLAEHVAASCFLWGHSTVASAAGSLFAWAGLDAGQSALETVAFLWPFAVLARLHAPAHGPFGAAWRSAVTALLMCAGMIAFIASLALVRAVLG